MTGVIGWAYAVIVLVMLSLFAVAFFFAEPGKTQAAKGSLALLVLPTAFFFLMLFGRDESTGELAVEMWLQGLTFFRWRTAPSVMPPPFGEAISAGLTGIAAAVLVGGALLAHVAARNPIGRARVIEALGVAGGAIMMLRQHPAAAAHALLRTACTVAAVAVICGGVYFVTPWDRVGAWALGQVRPGWISQGAPIHVRSDVRGPTVTRVQLDSSWRRIVLPQCGGTYTLDQLGRTVIEIQLPDRRRLSVRPEEDLRLPAMPRWIRGSGEIRVIFTCRS